MHLMYVDESGDSGLLQNGSPTRFYALSGLVLHELRWRQCLDDLIAFRRRLRDDFGLKFHEEFHAAAFINEPGELVRVKRHERLNMIRLFALQLAAMPDLRVISVLVDKEGKPADYDVFSSAWRALIQRFENTISHHNFPGPRNIDDRGMILCDHTEDVKLMRLLRKMRRFNPVPHRADIGRGSRDMPLRFVIEDPSHRDSAHSYFVQAADLTAFLLYQREAPGAYVRKKGARNWFSVLTPVLCRQAAPADPDGIVRL
jgi:hypothetical protein